MSDPDTCWHLSFLIAEDPELQKSIRGLEAMLRVRASLGSGREKGVLAVVSPSPCRQAPGSCLANDSEFPLKNGIRAAPGLCSETDSEFPLKNGGRDRTAHATAGESDEIIGSSRLSELEFPTLNSSGCVAAVACARLPAVPGLSASAPSPAFPSASLAVGAHARSTPMRVAHNSWSDTVRVQGPTGKRCTKGVVSGPAEDLRPCLRGGGRGKFSAGLAVYGGRLQVHFPGGNEAQVPGRSREVWSHLPSTRRFLVSNSCHLDTDWTSGNQWARRRCVEPHSRGFGC